MVVEEQKIEVEGLPTRYLAAGDGPPLLLLHGVGDNAFDWQWVMPALAHTYRVYALDLPGSGGSAKLLPDYSAAFFTRFAAAFLDALGVERAAVVGNSLGGLVGLRLALSDPERVAALGLVSSGGLGGEVSPTLCVRWPCPATASWRSLGARGVLGLSRGPWAAPHSFSRVPGVCLENGSRSSTGWRGYRAFWRPSWRPFAPRSDLGDSARCW